MKILIDCRTLQTYSAFRGIGRHTRQLIQTFKDDQQCFFLFFKEKNLQPDLLRKLFIHSPRHFITLTDSIWLKKLLVQNTISIYHSTAFALPSKTRRKHYILTVHDLTPIRYPQFSPWRHRFIFRMIMDSSRNADIVIAVSRNTADDLLNYFPLKEDKIRVVHNALDGSINPDYAVKPKMNLPSEYLFYTGGGDKIKNIKTIVQTIQILNIPLVIAGKISEQSKKELLLFMDPRYKKLLYFTGFIHDNELSYLYQNAISFLFPSLYEGFGYPPLESIKCGTPPVVTKTGALTEILGDAALYVDNPLDPEAFAEKIKTLIHNSELRRNLLEKGRTILEQYSMENFKKKIQDVYNSLSNC